VTSEHYVVLGAARPRAAWFADLGRWATSAALPVEFVRCVSADEVRARLAAGRSWSAAIIDDGCIGLDRDLIEEARRAGCAPVVVTNSGSRRRWTELGAVAVLVEPVDRDTILAVLREHASPVERNAGDVLSAEAAVAEVAWTGGVGRLVTVVGAGGTGTSTIAMAIAQAAGADPANGGRVALVDAALDASLALLHDNGDVVPGLQELVELHRTRRPDPDQVRGSLWACPERGYDLLPGLRRHRDWTALRPRALAATITSLRRSYATVVADAEADLEGEAETGSLDIEDRNACARVVTTAADVVVVTGVDGVVGVHRLVRTLAALIAHGVDPARLLPVVNRAPRSPRRRAETARTVALLLGELVPGAATVGPLMVPARRDLEAIQLDGSPLPRVFCVPLGEAVAAVVDRAGERGPVDTEAEPVAVRPGSLGLGGAT
jgi:MinD-like ATPase involved in chromosome partitioning or flagellar assembly